MHKEKKNGETAYVFGERFPSGVIFCFAAPSLRMTGALGDMVRGAAEVEFLSVWAPGCAEGARLGKVDEGLESGSDGGGASGAATDATAVDMVP